MSSRKSRSEFLSAIDTAFEIWKAIADAVLAAGGSDADQRSLKDDKVRLKSVAADIVRRPAKTASAVETVKVPDLPAAALVATVKEEIGLAYLDGDYAKWDFIRDERGKTYEVATWAPRRPVSTETVREHFAALGGERPWSGNTAAFLQWIRTNRRDGWFVSIPEEDRLFRDKYGDLSAPHFYRDGADRVLRLFRVADRDLFRSWVPVGWCAGSVFVAFRECL